MALSFEDKEADLLKRLACLYKDVKAHILFAEELDPNYEGNAQVWKELRDALDHLMRVFSKKLEEDPASEYINSNICKAIGHVYRAGCDALEGTCFSLRDEFNKICENYDLRTLDAVIPNFWAKKTRIIDLSEKIAKLRGEKDVSDPNMEAIFESFLKIAKELREIYDEVRPKVPQLKEYQNKLDKEDKKSSRKSLKLNLISGLVWAFIGFLFSKILTFVHLLKTLWLK